MPCRPDPLKAGQLVVDLVYHPAGDAPPRRGARTRVTAVNGLGMLDHQAARAFRLWTGQAAPLEAMSAAALGALVHQ